MGQVKLFVEINAAGLPRGLFSVREASKDDLTVILKNRVGYAPIGTLSPVGAPSVIEHRYSVHASLNSPFNINVIKRSLRLSDNRKQVGIMHTRSLKQTNCFTPLFSDQCPNLNKPKHMTLFARFLRDGHDRSRDFAEPIQLYKLFMTS